MRSIATKATLVTAALIVAATAAGPPSPRRARHRPQSSLCRAWCRCTSR